MEKVEYPDSLIFPDSYLKIYFENKLKVTQADASIIIEGNPSGFISLSNLINVHNVYLFDEIVITDFSFVNSEFKFSIVEEPELRLPDGYVIKKNKDYVWKINFTNLFVVTGMLHSLGYANKELNFDHELNKDDISVYCVLI